MTYIFTRYRLDFEFWNTLYKIIYALGRDTHFTILQTKEGANKCQQPNFQIDIQCFIAFLLSVFQNNLRQLEAEQKRRNGGLGNGRNDTEESKMTQEDWKCDNFNLIIFIREIIHEHRKKTATYWLTYQIFQKQM